MGRNGIRIAAAALGFAAIVWVLIDRSGDGPSVPGPSPLPAERPAAAASVPPATAPAFPETRPVSSDGVLVGRLARGAPPLPLEGRVEVAAGSGPARAVASGQDGRFRIEGLPRGLLLRIEARAEGLPPARCSGIRVPVVGPLDIGDLPLGPGESVEVRILGPRNEPVAGASVGLRRVVDNRGPPPDLWDPSSRLELGRPGEPEFRAVTGPAGSATIPGVPPGDWMAVAGAPGLTEGAAWVRRVEGLLRDPAVIRLRGAVTLAGRVLAADGTPAAGVRILPLWRYPWYPSTARLPDPPEVTAGADGSFLLTGLPGAVEIWARTDSGLSCSLGTVRAPLPGPCILRLPPCVPLRGRVVDAATGEPVEGAEVLADWVAWWDQRDRDVAFLVRTISGSGGEFRAEAMPAASGFRLRVRKEGFVPFEETSHEPCVPAAGSREVRLSKGGALRGRTLRADGTPVSGALVWAWAIREEDAEPFHRDELGAKSSRTRSGADGGFRLAGLPVGKAMVVAVADGLLQRDLPLEAERGYHPDRVPDSLKALVPESGEGVCDVVLLPGGTLSGVVVDGDGRPMPGMAVRVGSWPRVENGNTARVPDGDGICGPTGPDGAFRIEGVIAGTQRFVWAHGAGGIQGWSRTFDVAEGEIVGDLRIIAGRQSAAITGRVLHEDGSPAAGAEVSIGGWSVAVESVGEWGHQEVPADAEGRFRLEVPLAGRYLVSAAGNTGGVAPGIQVEVAAGETRSGVEIVVPVVRSVSGRVLGPDGSPIGAAAVLVEPVGEDQEAPPDQHGSFGMDRGPRIPVERRATATADIEGRFLKEGLVGEEFWVSASAPGFLEGWVRAKPGGPEAVVRLERGLSISGRVVDDATGAPLEGIPFDLQEPEGARLPRSRDWSRTGKDGTFEFEDLPAGAYRLRFAMHWNDPGLEYPESEVEGVAAGTAGVEVRLRRALVLGGKVVDQEGNPVADLSLQLDMTEGDARPFGPGHPNSRTAKDGSFQFGGLKAGTYRISAGPAITFASNPGDRAVAGARFPGLVPDRRDLVLTVQRGLPVRGVVLDALGRPARGAGSCGRIVVMPSGEAEREGEGNVFFAHDGGRFTTAALPPGQTYDLYASGFADCWTGVLRGVAPGATVEIRLEAGCVLAGRVVDEAGAAAPEGVLVHAMADDVGPQGHGTWEYTQTVAGGTFRFTGLADRKFRIRAGGRGSDFLEGETKDLFPAGATDVVVVLKRGVAIEGRLLDAKGKPVPFPRVCARDEGEESRGEEDGSFRIAGLTPGRKRLTTNCQIEKRWVDVDLGTFEAPCSGIVLTLPAHAPPEEPEPAEEPEGDPDDPADGKEGE